MSMAGILRRARSEGGFSMAEVTIAALFFMVAVLGMGNMLMSAGGLVNKSASQQMAARLASEKIEAVKSLPFYNPSSSTAKVDIDDYYYNMSKNNNEQFAYPTTYGTEATIANAPGYSRSTAVEYVYVQDSPKQLAPLATMDANWVNTNPTGTKFDRPKSLTPVVVNPSAILIEVKVIYTEDGLQRTLVQHGLASQYVTSGGASLTPLLVAKSITPTSGNVGNVVSLDVTIEAPDLTTTDNGYEQMGVALWRPGGTADINGTGVSIISSSLIRCSMDLTGTTGGDIYSVAVTWGRRGVSDNNLRNCFTITVAPPTIDSVTSSGEATGTAWGYKGQNLRQLEIYGTNFSGVLNDTLKVWVSSAADPETGTPRVLGNITLVDGGATHMKATFVLTGLGGANENWNFKVKNTNSSQTKTGCFMMNPSPTVTSITHNPDSGYYNWGYRYTSATTRRVYINGTCLYGIGDGGASSLQPKTSGSGTNRTGTVNTSVSGNNITYSGCTYAIIDYAVSTSTSECPNLTDWKIYVKNGGLGDVTLNGTWTDLGTTPGTSGCFRMNPQSKISTVGSPLTRKISNTSVSITGFYFQPSAGSTTAVGLSKGSESVSGGSTITASSETAMTFTANLSIGQGTISAGGSSDEIGAWTVKVTNPDVQLDTVDGTTTVNEAPQPHLTTTPSHTFGYNYWDNSMSNIAGTYIDPSYTDVQLLTSGDVYDTANPNSTQTVTGETVGTGSYPSTLTISNMVANCINLPTGTYRVRVKDTENGQLSDNYCSFTVEYKKPVVLGSSGSSTWPNVTLGSQTVHHANGSILNNNGDGCTHVSWDRDNSSGANEFCDSNNSFLGCANGRRPYFSIVAKGLYGTPQLELYELMQGTVTSDTNSTVTMGRADKYVRFTCRIVAMCTKSVGDYWQNVRLYNATGWSDSWDDRVRDVNNH